MLLTFNSFRIFDDASEVAVAIDRRQLIEFPGGLDWPPSALQGASLVRKMSAEPFEVCALPARLRVS